METCAHCDLPLVECSSLVVARTSCELYLREHGYTGLKAHDASYRLIPEPKRK